LLGTIQDWKDIRARVRALGEYECSEWVNALGNVLDELVAAAGGRVNVALWQSFYKGEGGSGGPYVTGWINSFFPYVRDSETGRYDVPNPFAVDRGTARGHASGPCTGDLPTGLSRVPFIWEYERLEYRMQFLAGFVGVSQAPDSHAVRPAIGWAVRQTKPLSGERLIC